MWHDFIGKAAYYAGVSGTITLGKGEILHLVTVHAPVSVSASFTIFGGPPITVIASGPTAPPAMYQFYHTLFVAPFAGSSTLVFTNTDHFFVHTIQAGNAPYLGNGYSGP